MDQVTVGIPTKGRYHLLAHTLQSVALQTLKPKHVMIVDDSEPGIDMRTSEVHQNMFHLLSARDIDWEVIWGRKLGQHFSHQLVQDRAQTELIWRIDDDEIAEPDVLEKLVRHFKDPKVGAVGGLVIVPPPLPRPANADNVIRDLSLPNLQWFKAPQAKHSPESNILELLKVEHLTSTFVYRKGIAKFDLSLSPAAHREETIFTHEIFRAGYELLVDASATTWHFRSPVGGIRAHGQAEFWEGDEAKFQARMREWGIEREQTKLVIVDAGRGDHCLVKSLIPELKERWGKIILATCFPEIMAEDGVEQISIAEAKYRMGNIDWANPYRKAIEWNWKGPFIDVYRKIYDLKGGEICHSKKDEASQPLAVTSASFTKVKPTRRREESSGKSEPISKQSPQPTLLPEGLKEKKGAAVAHRAPFAFRAGSDPVMDADLHGP